MHRRLASPLHAARASCAGAYGAALGAAALTFEHPLVLLALAAVAVGAGAAAGVLADMRTAARLSLVLAVLVALVNALVVRDGLTVLLRLGELPPFGQVDVTLEALVYGLVLGARVVVIVLISALLTATIDPDEVLAGLSRFGPRTALTAVLALRMVPVLARDARRLDDARRCRPGDPPSRLAVLRAVTGGALDRAQDVAATLEVRGYGVAAPRARRATRRPLSRHDLAFAASAAAIAALVVAARIAGVASFAAYPSLSAVFGAREMVLAGALVMVALLPFASRRGVAR